MRKNKWVLLIANLILIAIFFFLFAPEYSFIQYMNAFFYICIGYLLLFLILYILKGGFFDGIIYSFRRFHQYMFKNDDYLLDWREKPLPSEGINKRVYSILKFQSMAMLVLLTALILVYFLTT